MSETFVNLLASRLLSEQVLFFVGAGLSQNWGLPGGRDVAAWLGLRFARQGREADAATRQVLSDCASALDLPLVAEALVGGNKCRFLRELFYAPEDPPKGSRFFVEADELAAGDPVRDGRIGLPHVVLGRLAKEGLIQEILTTNYDCLLEAGCRAVGMVPYEAGGGPAQDRALGMPWPEAYRVISNAEDVLERAPRRSVLHLYKIHGCIAALRSRVMPGGDRRPVRPECQREEPCDGCDLTQERFNFVITYRELLDWRRDHWARDLFYDRVRTHHVVFIGFHGEDWVLHGALRSVFEEARRRGRGVRAGRDGAAGPVEGTDSQLALAAAAVREAASGAETLLDSPGVRAQATELDPNLFIWQILREAAGRAWDPAAQIWPLRGVTGSEAGRAAEGSITGRVEALFRATYVTTMRGLVDRLLDTYGPPWIESVVPAAGGGEEEDLQAYRRALDRMRAEWLQCLPEVFWFEMLPAAVRTSWVLAHPGVVPDVHLMRRLERPHYYVPLGQDWSVTFPLVWFYAQVLAAVPQACCLPDGWVVLPPRQCPRAVRWVAPLVFPLLAPSRRRLARRLTLPRPEIRPPRGLERSPVIRPALVLIGHGQGAGSASLGAVVGVAGMAPPGAPPPAVAAMVGAGRRLPAVAGVVGARPPANLTPVPLGYEDLLREDRFHRWLKRLYAAEPECTGGVEENGAEGGG